MNIEDIAYVGYYSEIEKKDEHRRVLNKIAYKLKTIEEPTENDLTEICIMNGIYNLTTEDMMYIGEIVEN